MKALIVDDERLARGELRRLLREHSEIEIVGEAVDADDALLKIDELHPDLLFLDIQMPGRTGFELLEELERAPLVVFTTAYDEFALKAFEVSALDYLLKPVDPKRLAATIERVLAFGDRAAPVLWEHERIFVRDGERCWFVELNEIVLLESDGNYTRLYFGAHRPHVLRSLNYLESRLDPRVFFRAGKKQIVNIRWIEGVELAPGGGLVVKLPGGIRVAMSRRQSQKFREMMKL